MRRLLAVSWILTLLTHAAPAAARNWQAEAQGFGARHDWRGLAGLAHRWTAAEPRNSLAWVTLGDAYGEMGALGPMEQAMRQAAALTPSDPRPWELMAAYHAKRKDFSHAIPFLQQAVRVAPNDPASWLGLATQWNNLATQRQFNEGAAPAGALVDAGTAADFRAAGQGFARALALHAAPAGFLYRQIANCWLNANNYRHAIRAYIRGMNATGLDSYALNGLALASHDLQAACARVTSRPGAPGVVIVTRSWTCDQESADLVHAGLGYVARGGAAGR